MIKERFPRSCGVAQSRSLGLHFLALGRAPVGQNRTHALENFPRSSSARFVKNISEPPGTNFLKDKAAYAQTDSTRNQNPVRKKQIELKIQTPATI